MAKLLLKPNPQGALIHDVSKDSAGWGYVGFQVLKLKAGETFAFDALNDTERCFTVLTGKCDVSLDKALFAENIGERESVFEDKSPYAVYVPPKVSVEIKALSDNLEIGISTAPAEGKYPPRLIKPEEMKRSVRGKGSNTRYICDILPETDKSAESLLVVEVITPNGNTSSYPPHKHDQATATETYLEETYYHRINPPQGFAFQRVYTDDRSLDEAMAVEDGDVVLVPKGYHPCATIHGYDLYYLNTMAGGERRWQFYNAPEHEWLLKV
ncbi:MAG: 5-deoxy-glucuronate isomerase [Cardiobacteriaceae bacterium]|nr:5-deoxy-glucuronate isomerase [Cardiobacteriaceae bacterium]